MKFVSAENRHVCTIFGYTLVFNLRFHVYQFPFMMVCVCVCVIRGPEKFFGKVRFQCLKFLMVVYIQK